MATINIDDIQRDLRGFLHRVEAGETLLIMEAGKPLAELKPIASLLQHHRPFGLCMGDFTVPDDFDDPLPDGFVDEAEIKPMPTSYRGLL